MAYTHERTGARKCAAQILYTGAIRNASALELLKAGDISCLESTVSDYAYSLVEGVEAHLGELDERLAAISKNWSIERMPVMDLAILRIALYEMLYVDVVPISVSINEAVEMAKAFGGEDDSPKFVNGMLGNVARELEGIPQVADVPHGQPGDEDSLEETVGDLADVASPAADSEEDAAQGEALAGEGARDVEA